MEALRTYFETIVSPKKIFRNRNYLTTFQKVLFVIFFLILLNVPLALSIFMTDTIDFYNVVPEAEELVIDEQVLTAVKDLETVEQDFVIPERTQVLAHQDGQVVLLPTGEELNWKEDDGLVLAIREETIEIYDPYLEPEHNPTVDFAFVDADALQASATPEEFSSFLVDQWKENEATSTKRALMFNLVNLVTIFFLFIFISFSAIIFLFKFFKGFMIENYAEAFTISLNAFGLGTLIVFFVGLFIPTPFVMLPLQLLISAIMIIISFVQTSFKDEELLEESE